VDEVTFEQFVAVRGPTLLRVALMLCGDPHRAEDLVQSALARVYRHWSRVLASARPEAYVRAMVVNEFLSWRRRRSSGELPVDDAVRRAEGTAGGVADPAGGQAARDAAWRLLGTLPRRQRAVLVLRYYEDLPDNEIAVVLGCSASTVRSTASRALATLRDALPALDQEARP
jgi:RNA polymerase sigma-70 factor (sigma-E family)